MELSRRTLLQLGLVQAGTWALPAKLQATEILAKSFRYPSILQGATDETKTQFSIVHLAGKEYDFRVSSAHGEEWLPDRIVRHELNGQQTAVTQIFFSGLALGATFTLKLTDLKDKRVADERQFSMLDTKKANLRYAVCSCMDDNHHAPQIWRDLIAQRPDVIFFAGDSTYCDYGSESDSGEARLWRRFAEARGILEIYASRQLIPIFATWDDHDYGQNDSGRDFPFRDKSQVNFMRFFAMDPSHCAGLSRGPGVSSRLILSGQQFFLMDDRSFRVAGRSSERYAHWGKEQELWLLNHTTQHKGMNWILNGSQLFPQMPFKQSFSGEHAQQFIPVLEALRAQEGRVAFISGDVHFSEISKIERGILGYETFELTSSSMHSRGIGPGFIPNSRRIASTGERNYLLVESEAVDRGCNLIVESRSAGNTVLFRNQLRIV